MPAARGIRLDPHRRAGPAFLFVAGIVMMAISTVEAVPVRFDVALVARFAERYGADARERLLGWESLMLGHVSAPGARQRRAANDFFNAIPWLSDDEHWGQRDYWATPMEMLGTNGGDCEDFSIAKYHTLAELDVPTDQLLITYVRAPRLRQTHMVLAYYPTPDADPLILDNLNGEIRPGSLRKDLIPVYSFNGQGLWMAKQRGRGKRVGSSTRLKLWRDVQLRMKQERST